MSLSIRDIDFEKLLDKLFPTPRERNNLERQSVNETRVRGLLTELGNEEKPTQELLFKVMHVLRDLGVGYTEITSEAMLLEMFGKPDGHPLILPHENVPYYNPDRNVKAIITSDFNRLSPLRVV